MVNDMLISGLDKVVLPRFFEQAGSSAARAVREAGLRLFTAPLPLSPPEPYRKRVLRHTPAPRASTGQAPRGETALSSTKVRDDIRKVRAWAVRLALHRRSDMHEAGHALVRSDTQLFEHTPVISVPFRQPC